MLCHNQNFNNFSETSKKLRVLQFLKSVGFLVFYDIVVDTSEVLDTNTFIRSVRSTSIVHSCKYQLYTSLVIFYSNFIVTQIYYYHHVF